MGHLEPEEHKQLLGILQSVFKSIDATSRQDFLINRGVDERCLQSIKFDGSNKEFTEHFCAQLLRDKSLAVFLEWLIVIDNLPQQEREFIEKIVIPKLQGPKHHEISSLLVAGRSEPKDPLAPQQVKMDKWVMVEFDLKPLVSKFIENLGYAGPFAFSLGGDVHILQDYIIERLLSEFKHSMGRKYEQPIHIWPVWLYLEDILPRGTPIIERKIMDEKGHQDLRDLFDTCSGDIIIIIWNYDVPELEMRKIISSFWESACVLLGEQSRCFVVIWANVGAKPDPLDKFIDLTVPDRFETSELRKWFQRQFREHRFDEQEITQNLKRLERHYGKLIPTYHEIEQIIKGLN